MHEAHAAHEAESEKIKMQCNFLPFWRSKAETDRQRQRQRKREGGKRVRQRSVEFPDEIFFFFFFATSKPVWVAHLGRAINPQRVFFFRGCCDTSKAPGKTIKTRPNQPGRYMHRYARYAQICQL